MAVQLFAQKPIASTEDCDTTPALPGKWSLREEDKKVFARHAIYFLDNAIRKEENKTENHLKILIELAKKANSAFFEGKELEPKILLSAFHTIISQNDIKLLQKGVTGTFKLPLDPTAFTQKVTPYLSSERVAAIYPKPISPPPAKKPFIPYLGRRRTAYSAYSESKAEREQRTAAATPKPQPEQPSKSQEEVSVLGKSIDSLDKELKALNSLVPPLLKTETPPPTQGAMPKLPPITMTTSQAHHPTPPKDVKLPNPYKPNPLIASLSEKVGISMDVSRGKTSAQISVIAGPKDLPQLPLQRAALANPNHDSGNPYGGSLALPEITQSIDAHIRQARDQVQSSLRDYDAKSNELSNAISNYDPRGSLDQQIAQLTAIINKADDVEATAIRAMGDAFELNRRTDHEHRKKYERRCHGVHKFGRLVPVNHEAKDILRKKFQIPQLDELKNEHLQLSGKLKDIRGLKNSYAGLKTGAEQAKEFQQIDRQYQAKRALLETRESSDHPLNPDAHAKELKELEELGKKRIESFAKRAAAGEVPAFTNETLNEIDSLRRRDPSYQAIFRSYQEYCAIDDVDRAAEQKDRILARAALLVSQVPNNHEKNDVILKIAEDVKARYQDLALSKADAAFNATNQELSAKEAQLKGMLNSDEPIDHLKYSEELAAFETLSKKQLGQFNQKAALTPQSLTSEEYQKSMQRRIDALKGQDLRYAKVLSDYKKLCELPLDEFEKQQTKIKSAIADLLAQCPENAARNAELKLIEKDIVSMHRLMLFCHKTPEEKEVELDALKDNPDDYQIRLSLLSSELAEGANYEKLSAYFQQFAASLTREESLSSKSIDLLSKLCGFIQDGVKAKKLDPMMAIPLLEGIEKKHARKDLDQIRLSIGQLFILSNVDTEPQAKRWYETCRQIQPKSPVWPRALALCQLETLHFTLAEDVLAEALKLAPSDQETARVIDMLVSDEYESASLLLEWVVALTATPQKKEPLNLFAALLKITHNTANILSHPILQKKWLPFALRTQFKDHLVKLLERDESNNWNFLNATTFALRIISPVASTIQSLVSQEAHPYIHQGAQVAATVAKKAGSVAGSFLSAKRLIDLNSKLRSDKLSWAEFSAHSSLLLTNQLSVFVPLLETLAYRSQAAKAAAQKASPNLHAAINAVASHEFASAVVLSELAWRSSRLIARGVTRLTGVRPKPIERIVQTAAVSYACYQGLRLYFRSKEEILAMTMPAEEKSDVKSTSWRLWNYLFGQS